MSEAPLLSIKNLSLGYHATTVVSNISLSIAPGELVTIMGGNGCGKSTLLKAIAARATSSENNTNGNDLCWEGHLALRPALSLAYLPQVGLSGRELEGKANHSLLFRTAARFGLVLDEIEPDRLSEGQRQKLSLASVLACDADLILLDEPTNFLDLGGVDGFEQMVIRQKQRGCGFLLVTHDRSLADNLADRTLLISANGIYSVEGGYSAAWSLKTTDYESRQRQAADIKRKMDQLQADARRRSTWAANKEKTKKGAKLEKPHIAKMAKKMAARSKAVEMRAERARKDLEKVKPFVPKTVNLKIEPYTVRHRTFVRLDRVDFDYMPDRRPPLLKQLSFELSTASKTCLLGANGAGKTTLLNLILGKLKPLRGNIHRNGNVSAVYLPQGLKGVFDNGSLLDNMGLGHHDETQVRQYLGAALLRRDKVTEAVERFSPGELMRAAVVRCLLDKAEFMILDEPTSNLDIESIEVLEHLLQEFPGGFLLISHDRSFVQNIARQLIVIENGELSLM
ncbi:MAG TPA: ATP-binding cassette domain-containing protein [candidate division Zixibacteria bacterium]|nr:ATP-binding cassette domain-containing protein [candidate division Zixibacteria bacterium]